MVPRDGSAATGQSHATAVPVSWAVQSDQNASSGTGYQRSDFLYAPPTDISFKPSGGADNSLTFYHQTARVVINIVNAEAATNASAIQSVVIGDASNLALSGSYTAPTGEGATAGTWIPATSGSDMGTITPKKLTAPGTLTGGGAALASYAALVIPQQMKDKKFIAVTLTDGSSGSNTYYYTPTQDSDADLQSGKQHTYDITVKHGYLSVTSSASPQWTGSGETINGTEKSNNP
ncbi:fimbrillin family protein [Bacteroides stercorirosoris]|uniref:fimbrillin family protein n=1 Tax=Bacteroides stercorirosoris TaxID=871324 RepID=UPI0021CDE576|nr:fimbrillin family protein [Bacteroides stercorirosoris]